MAAAASAPRTRASAWGWSITGWRMWVRFYTRHQHTLMALPETERVDRLCELNVAEQFHNVCQTHTVRDAWARDQPLSVHGWVYGLQDGRLSELGLSALNPA